MRSGKIRRPGTSHFELEEAAWIDGASTLSTLWHIILPLAAPGIAVAGVWSFLGAWTNFFVPLIILQSQNLLPASVNIYTFFGSYGQVNYGQLCGFSRTLAASAKLCDFLEKPTRD